MQWWRAFNFFMVAFWLYWLGDTAVRVGKEIGYAGGFLLAGVMLVLARMLLEILSGRFGRKQACNMLRLSLLIIIVGLIVSTGLGEDVVAMLGYAVLTVVTLGEDDDFEDGIKKRWKKLKEKAKAFSRPVMGDLKPS